jgi:hypothetical protein
MDIKIEVNSDLALRRTGTNGRLEAECLPPVIKVGEVYEFLKKGQWNYWLENEIPLFETNGNQIISKPLASIIILESTHFLMNNEVYTRGRYKITAILPKFEGYKRIA